MLFLAYYSKLFAFFNGELKANIFGQRKKIQFLTATNTSYTMWQSRIAVYSFFFINGYLYANWAARLPEFQRFFDINNSILGIFLLLIATGAMIAMPVAGWLNTQVGSKVMTRWGGLFYCIIIGLITFYPNVYYVGGLFLFLGATIGALDVSMNGQAVYIERAVGKPIMSSFHALFSIGMTAGAGSGALFAKLDIILTTHFQIISVASAILLGFASFYLVEDQPDEESKKESKGIQLPTKAILPLGLIALFCMMGEGAMADWSAIYMNTVVGTDEAFSALAFGIFTGMMTVGRIFGDYFTLRLGRRKLLMWDVVLSFIGLSLILGFASPWISLIGFGLVGLGVATIVPIIYSTAGNTPGVAPSVGIAMATTIGYGGFFFGPPTIGFLSDAFGLRIALVFVLVLFVVMFFLIEKFIKSH